MGNYQYLAQLFFAKDSTTHLLFRGDEGSEVCALFIALPIAREER